MAELSNEAQGLYMFLQSVGQVGGQTKNMYYAASLDAIVSSLNEKLGRTDIDEFALEQAALELNKSDAGVCVAISDGEFDRFASLTMPKGAELERQRSHAIGKQAARDDVRSAKERPIARVG